ncbi:MAG: hypothetical protein RL011_502 [Pseudomonadota bacterium]
MDVLKRNLGLLATGVFSLALAVSCNQAKLTGTSSNRQGKPATVGSNPAPKPPSTNPQPTSKNKVDACVARAPGNDQGSSATASDIKISGSLLGGTAAAAAAGGGAAAAAAASGGAAAAAAGGAAAAAAASGGASVIDSTSASGEETLVENSVSCDAIAER